MTSGMAALRSPGAFAVRLVDGRADDQHAPTAVLEVTHAHPERGVALARCAPIGRPARATARGRLRDAIR